VPRALHGRSITAECGVWGRDVADPRADAGADERLQEQAPRLRGRTGLTQRQLAGRTCVSVRPVQDWESGPNHPGAANLRALIASYLEVAEARALWAAVELASSRMRTPFDPMWFARLLGERGAPAEALEGAGAGRGGSAPTANFWPPAGRMGWCACGRPAAAPACMRYWLRAGTMVWTSPV